MSARTMSIKPAQTLIPRLLLMIAIVGIAGCRQRPSITFLEVPPASSGGSTVTRLIRGHVTGSHLHRHIVLYSFAGGHWWVQPLVTAPSTSISDDGSWKAQVHLGTQYAALLGKDDVVPAPLLDALPAVGNDVFAVNTIQANGTYVAPAHKVSATKTLRFNGFDWQVRTINGDYGGRTNEYSSENVFLDEAGALHMRITRDAGGWVCSEVHSVRSLGYGDYRLQAEDVGQLEPAIMFSMFTFLAQPTDGDYREMDIHITRRGEPTNKNAEFVVAPYFVPVDFYYFDVPAGPLALQLKWFPERAEFSASRPQKTKESPLEFWSFNTGVPKADGAQIYINLCNYGNARIPPTHNAEVVVKSFDFFP
ncbi:hypothetical protein BH10ACI4_BH10ACI4_18840 [soil metagenome]